MSTMKLKKFLTAMLLSATLVGGGLTHAKTVDAALSKKQAIAIVKKKESNQTSGQYTTSTKIKSGKQKINFDSHGAFTTKPELVQAITKVKSGKHAETVEQWIDMDAKRVYTKADGKWQYTPIADADTAKTDIKKYSSDLKKFAKSITTDLRKNAKLSHKEGVYTLKSNVNITKASKFLNKIFKDYKVDLKSFKKHVKLSNCKVTFKIKDKKITSTATSFKMNYDKKTPASFNFRIFGLGNSDSLKLPDEVKNATPASAN